MPTVTVSSVLTSDDSSFPYNRRVLADTDEVAAGTALLSAILASSPGEVVAVDPGTYRVNGAGAFDDNNLTIAALGGAGKAPVKITGAVILTGFTQEGVRWYKSHTFQPKDTLMRDGTYSVCELSAVDGSNTCWNRDQVWIDDSRMYQTSSLANGDAGVGNRFYIDRTLNRVYIWTNPSGRTIEIDKTPYFVNDSTANDLTFRRITFEKFASPLQRSGVSVRGNGWEFDNCVFQNMHGSGLHHTNVTDLRVHDCSFLSNGQIGATVAGQTSGTTYSNIVFEYCSFISNNMEDFYIGDWEAGAFKTTSKSGGIVRYCTFSDNRGLDLWADFAEQWVFEHNTSTDAWGQAIRIEVSKNCIVRNNTIVHSGHNIGDHYRASHTNWSTVMDTCGISISESQYVECYNNTVDSTSLNGIIVNVRSRATTHHVFVHDNTSTQRQAPIPTGDTGTSTFGTMIAGGINMSGTTETAASIFANPVTWSMPAVGPSSGSGVSASQSVQVSGNHYRIGSLTTTPRFVWRNGASGTGTTYMAATSGAGNNYTALNPNDATDILV